MGETALVASQPDRTGTITVYKRMAYVGVRENGSWYTYVNGVDAGEDLDARRSAERGRRTDEEQ